MDKPFPADWHQPITARGVTKNNQARCYNVRINVQGKQLHVATSSSQSDAAYLYDLALWKLCPKMRAKLEPNDPEVFSFLSQSKIDNHCSRLNKLYASVPFLQYRDECRPEEELRNEAQGREPRDAGDGMADYDKAVAFLSRTVVELADLEVKLANRMSKVTKLHKLAHGKEGYSDTEFDLGCARRRFEALKESMQRQRPYYQKLIAP